MAAAWERAKRALATRLCIGVPPSARRVAVEDARTARQAVAPAPVADDNGRVRPPGAPSPASSLSSPRLSRSSSRSSTFQNTCTICLRGMRSGHGQALFTAECSHKFHFNCISKNVEHGNLVCPICRAVWKELPFQTTPPSQTALGSARVRPLEWPQDDQQRQQQYVAVNRVPSRANSASRQGQLPIFRAPDQGSFDDDEEINLEPETVDAVQEEDAVAASVEMVTHAEFPAIEQSVTQETFAILIHLKAPRSAAPASSRAPIDLVTVLDVSGSMKGTKLVLLKRAMGFVIQALGPDDRLSVVAFSSSARRLFPLRRMTEVGRRQSSHAVNSLAADGGTNIAEGLSHAARVMEGRQATNPVCSIILLSDGQDNHTVAPRPDYGALVPRSVLPGSGGHHVQIHSFGLGADHDAAAMHSIAEMSGGTFSCIDAVGSIQDAFAQCIGGLLSVVAQEVRLSVECADQGVLLTSIRSGGYPSRVDTDGRGGFVDVGHLYADEERDFLVTVRVPAARASGHSSLVVPRCTYRAAATTETVRIDGDSVGVARPAHPVLAAMSPAVEREWHRVHAMEDMAAARAAAEQGDFARAVAVLESRRRALESWLAVSADAQLLALVAELREMQDRVESRQRYEESGRAYILAGLSSHSWQRATARGDSTELNSLIHTYQTPLMLDMLHRSQMLLPEVAETLNRSPSPVPMPMPLPPPPRSSASPRRLIRPTRSFPGRPW